MQHVDAKLVANCHTKSHAILVDFQKQEEKIAANFAKWFNEYGVVQHKLDARDALYQKVQKVEKQLLQLDNDKVRERDAMKL